MLKSVLGRESCRDSFRNQLTSYDEARSTAVLVAPFLEQIPGRLCRP